MDEFEEYSIDSVVCGHHVYKTVWTLVVGEILIAEQEDMNAEDQYAVAVMKTDNIVVHRHHVYKTVWTPVVGEVLIAEQEDMNAEDQYAVVVMKTGKTVWNPVVGRAQKW